MSVPMTLLIVVLAAIAVVLIGSVVAIQCMGDDEREKYGHGPKGQGR